MVAVKSAQLSLRVLSAFVLVLSLSGQNLIHGPIPSQTTCIDAWDLRFDPTLSILGGNNGLLDQTAIDIVIDSQRSVSSQAPTMILF